MEEDEEEEERLHCSELASQRIQLPRAGLIVEASSPIASILLVWRGPAFSRWRCLVEQGSAVRQSWSMSSAGQWQVWEGLFKAGKPTTQKRSWGLRGGLREAYASLTRQTPKHSLVLRCVVAEDNIALQGPMSRYDKHMTNEKHMDMTNNMTEETQWIFH